MPTMLATAPATSGPSDAVHARGCAADDTRTSQFLDGYDYCPSCRRLVRL